MTHRKSPSREPLPEWLIGLLVAIVIVTLTWIWLSVSGAGDDPSFEGTEPSAVGVIVDTEATAEDRAVTAGPIFGEPSRPGVHRA